MRLSLNLVWESISKWCLYLAIFLIPIFFLPWTLYSVNLNKQTLLITLVLLAFIAWLIKSISQGEFVCARSPINVLVGLLIIFVAFSAWFSGARSIGFSGSSGAEPDTFINILSFGLLYILLTSMLNEEREFNRVFKLLSWSSLLLVVFSLLQLFSIWLLPWAFTKDPTFNPIGASNALAIYLGFVFAVALAALYLGSRDFSRLLKIVLVILAVLAFLGVLLIAYWPVFAGLILAMLLLVIADLQRRGAEASRGMLLPVAIIALSLFMILSSFGLITFSLPSLALPAEITPSLKASWAIGQNTILAGAKNFILGSGPATYQYQYGFYREAALNQSLFWNLRFSQGFNALLTHLVNWGAAGTVIFLLLLLLLVLLM